MSYLQQSTTSTIKVGPILSATDLSALTSATLTVKLSKNGGTLAARHSETAIAHDADGNYTVELDATDSGTCGELTVAVTATGAIPWTKTYSVINELAYTELMGNKHDAVMLGEAIRQGYDPERDVIVQWADTEVGRGANLKAAYATAKALTPYGNALAGNNRARVLIPRGRHDVGMYDSGEWIAAGMPSVGLDLDTDYVDLIALFPERAPKQDKDLLIRSDWDNPVSHFRPQATVIVSGSTFTTTTMQQSAQNVKCVGFGIGQLLNNSNFKSFYISAETNEGSYYEKLYGYSRYGGSFLCARNFSGVWVDCDGYGSCWRIGTVAGAAVFSAQMYNCIGGPGSFIGDSAVNDEVTYVASGCYFYKCSVIGGFYHVGSDTYFTGHGFAGCSGNGIYVDDTCEFWYCDGGDRSFCLGMRNRGKYYYCIGGVDSFGGTTVSPWAGNFAGYAYRCQGKGGSFGGRYAGLAIGKCTGTLVECVITDNDEPHYLEGATIIDTTITMATTDQPVITLLDSASKIHNSTLLPVEGGTGVPIYAASALSVSAAGNTYGNKSAAANGLGSNVTNLATIDVVPKVDLTTAATSVTNAVTTDSASREASKADVSTLATTTALAAAKEVVDAIKVKSDLIPENPAAVGSAMTLSSGERSTLSAAIEAALVNDGDATALLQAIANKFTAEYDIENLSVAAIASAARDAILDRVLTGNHDTTGTLGKLIQTINTDAARLTADRATYIDKLETPADFKADVSGIPAAVKTAIEAAGSKLATIETATVTDIPTKIDNIEVATDAPSVAEIRAEMDANSTKLASINLATTDTIPTAIGNVSINTTGLAAEIASELGDVGGASVSDIVAALVGKNITVNSPVTADQDVEVYAADDYIDAWDRSLTWSNSGGDWAGGDLTSAVVTMAVVDSSGSAALTKTGSVVTATGTQSVMVELEEADVSLLTQEGKRYKYQLYVTKSGYRQTLATGSVTAVQPAAEVVEE